ncbi:MAG: hypothetical protein M1820_007822 [Bogoriella megaspora]|nr:MAG: hypothetical protein M1820_007822 [Bogoriella megaspora]
MTALLKCFGKRKQDHPIIQPVACTRSRELQSVPYTTEDYESPKPILSSPPRTHQRPPSTANALSLQELQRTATPRQQKPLAYHQGHSHSQGSQLIATTVQSKKQLTSVPEDSVAWLQAPAQVNSRFLKDYNKERERKLNLGYTETEILTSGDSEIGISTPSEPDSTAPTSVGPGTLSNDELLARKQSLVRRRPGLSIQRLPGQDPPFDRRVFDEPESPPLTEQNLKDASAAALVINPEIYKSELYVLPGTTYKPLLRQPPKLPERLQLKAPKTHVVAQLRSQASLLEFLPSQFENERVPGQAAKQTSKFSSLVLASQASPTRNIPAMPSAQDTQAQRDEGQLRKKGSVANARAVLAEHIQEERTQLGRICEEPSSPTRTVRTMPSIETTTSRDEEAKPKKKGSISNARAAMAERIQIEKTRQASGGSRNELPQPG